MRADYIIVGGGSSGAVLANRLSADPSVSVILLEAGESDSRLEVHIPAAFSKLFRSTVDWSYDTVPQPGLNDRTIYWPRGKMLGGSSSMNAMMWVRGYAADYDRWAQLASPDWGYQELLPYFRRVEKIADSIDPDQGTDGMLTIEHQRSPRSHTQRFQQALAEVGLPTVAPNTAQPDGFTQTMVNQSRGGRFSTADAYLEPIERRRNLTVITGAQATRVVFENPDDIPGARDGGAGPVAVGVDYVQGGRSRTLQFGTARATREVILAAGAVNTPQLLLLSGVGPADQLATHRIPVVADRAEVGENLRDHLVTGLIVEVPGDTLFDAERPAQLADYLVRKRGMLTSNVGEAYGFVRSRHDLPLPDLELLFAPVAFVGEGLVPPPRHGITLGVLLEQPSSSGRITLASNDPLRHPLIDPRYLSDPDGADRRAMMAGLALADRILHTDAFRGIVGDYIAPDGGASMSPDERYSAAIDDYAHTMYHPVGTCRMGSDADAVVDPQLRVRGVQRLRVADASIMPTIIRGHTHAPAVVIGEKAADLIRASGPTA
ncbi:GMC family oxidoreductase [Homoserinimonas sp. OAct 916]|uniref:GMC family oxidoreductase n=1 Tax=Homoserinimonas sp. OAct 916 TaxID=2211450 RepID=UPI0018E512F6|nr:GMC family oxidoreductase N-terminal domain-containing protein [Homoserinimonas sp. OAct 916]